MCSVFPSRQISEQQSCLINVLTRPPIIKLSANVPTKGREGADGGLGKWSRVLFPRLLHVLSSKESYFAFPLNFQGWRSTCAHQAKEFTSHSCSRFVRGESQRETNWILCTLCKEWKWICTKSSSDAKLYIDEARATRYKISPNAMRNNNERNTTQSANNRDMIWI